MRTYDSLYGSSQIVQPSSTGAIAETSPMFWCRKLQKGINNVQFCTAILLLEWRWCNWIWTGLWMRNNEYFISLLTGMFWLWETMPQTLHYRKYNFTLHKRKYFYKQHRNTWRRGKCSKSTSTGGQQEGNVSSRSSRVFLAVTTNSE